MGNTSLTGCMLYIYIYIYIYTYIHLKLKKTRKFLGKLFPYEISKSFPLFDGGWEVGEMSFVIPEFSKVIMELIIFQCMFHELLNQNSSLNP